jgi:hypothetical protein
MGFLGFSWHQTWILHCWSTRKFKADTQVVPYVVWSNLRTFLYELLETRQGTTWVSALNFLVLQQELIRVGDVPGLDLRKFFVWLRYLFHHRYIYLWASLTLYLNILSPVVLPLWLQVWPIVIEVESSTISPICNNRGENTLAISLWALTEQGARLSQVDLVAYGAYDLDREHLQRGSIH